MACSANALDTLQAIRCVAATWNKLTKTIKNCFGNFAIAEQTLENEEDELDEAFNTLFDNITVALECKNMTN